MRNLNALEPADKFKAFISNPPVISDLLYEEVHPGKGTNYLRLKWQPGAVYRGQTISNVFLLGDQDNLAHYIRILANYGPRFQKNLESTYYEWMDRGIEKEKDNSLVRTRNDLLEVDFANMLNMGCQLLPIGSVRWAGDRFKTINHARDFALQGELLQNDQGRASVLNVECQGLRSKKKEHYFKTYEYYYDKPLELSFYPNRIIAKSGRSKDEQLAHLIWTIYAIKIAPKPLSADHFLLPTAVLTDVVTRIKVSNEFLIVTDSNGKSFQRYDRPGLENVRRIERSYYFALAIMIMIAPPIFLWITRRKKQTQKYSLTKNIR